MTKKHLFGEVDVSSLRPSVPAAVHADDKIIGYALRNREKSKRPIFISAGHRMDAATALAVVRAVQRNHASPEPIYHADRISRRASK